MQVFVIGEVAIHKFLVPLKDKENAIIEVMNTIDFSSNRYTEVHPGYRELIVKDYPDSTVLIRLIPPSLHHAPLSLQWLQDAEVGQYMGADFSQLSLEGEEKRLQDILNDTDAYNWSIEYNGKVIGNVNINSITEKSAQNNCRSGSMAILIGDKNYWNKGLARFINRTVIEWAFSEGGFEILEARIMQQNVGSIKSFEALGLKLVSTEVDGEINGKPIIWNKYRLKKVQWHT